MHCVPYEVMFELTHRCNLSCRHCYIVDSGGNELSFDEISRCLGELANMGTFKVIFTGGEPLLRSDILDIVRIARRLGFATYVFTNGTLINSKIACEFVEAGVARISVSIYGACAATHDYVTRCRGSFQKTISGIRYLTDAGASVFAKLFLLKSNLCERKEAEHMLRNLGCKFMVDWLVNPRLNGDTKPMEIALDPREGARIDISRKKSLIAEYPQGDLPLCKSGYSRLWISPSGDIFPCGRLRIKCGNLRETSLRDVWYFSDILKVIREMQLQDLPRCASCKYSAYCLKCRGLNWLSSGDMTVPAKENCLRAAAVAELVQLESQKWCTR